jgi:flavin-binding protein dodecin
MSAPAFSCGSLRLADRATIDPRPLGRVHNSIATITVVASEEISMSVAKVSEISSTSTKSFEDAINVGLARASTTIRNIKSAWVKEQQVRLENGKIVEYQVNLMLTFVLED